MVVVRCPNTEFTGIKAVVFDKDGTLADSSSYLRNLAQKRARLIDAQVPGVQEPLLMAFGVEGDRLNPEGLMAVGTRPENIIAAAAYVAETGMNWPLAVELVQSVFGEADTYLPRKATATPPYPETQSLLERLKGTKVKIGIFSSDSTANVEDFVNFYKLTAFVDDVQGTDQGMPAKPDPLPLLQLCGELGVAPEHTLMVGDSLLDQKVAQNAGLAGCLWIDWTGDNPSAAQASSLIHHWGDIQFGT